LPNSAHRPTLDRWIDNIADNLKKTKARKGAAKVINSDKFSSSSNNVTTGRKINGIFRYMQEEKMAVYGIVFNDSRTEVLLIKRRDIPVWVLPGGGLDPGESPEGGALREVLEETGFSSRMIRKVAEYLPVNKMTKFSHLFECRITSGSMRTGPETKEVRFFPLNALPDLPPPYEGWIRDAAANHPTVLRKKIEGVSYWVLLKLLIQHPILVSRYLLTKLGIHINR
jgi:8-oxo-dGTP diphosphatase